MLVLADIVKEHRALEEAIGQVEADEARKLCERRHRSCGRRLRRGELPMAAHKVPRLPGGATPIRLRPICRKMDGPPCSSAPARDYSACGLREENKRQAVAKVLGDVHDLGTPVAAKAARQGRETYELRAPQDPSAEEPSRSSRELT